MKLAIRKMLGSPNSVFDERSRGIKIGIRMLSQFESDIANRQLLDS